MTHPATESDWRDVVRAIIHDAMNEDPNERWSRTNAEVTEELIEWDLDDAEEDERQAEEERRIRDEEYEDHASRCPVCCRKGCSGWCQ